MKILDTTIGETGTENFDNTEIIDTDKPIRFHCYLGSGDTVVIEGKVKAEDTYQVLYTFDADNTQPIDIYVSPYFRARRTVDGGGDSSVEVVESRLYTLKEHE